MKRNNMSFDEQELDKEHIDKYAKYQLHFDALINAILAKDSDRVGETFSVIMSEFCSTPEDVAQFLLWVSSMHAVAFSLLCRTQNIDPIDANIESGMFAMNAMDQAIKNESDES